MPNRNPIGHFLLRATGSAYILYHLIGQTQIPYLPTERLNEMRDRRVRAIVRYAAETVPFYRDLFISLRLDPRDFQTAADLAHLPLLDKQLVKENPRRFVSDSAEGQTAFHMATTGTTGLRLDFYHSLNYALANTAWSERQLACIRELLGPGVPFRQVMVGYYGNSMQTVRQQIREHAFVPNRTGHQNISMLEPLEMIIAEINRLRPNVLIAYGSFIELLFKTVRAQNIPMHRPKVVMYVSDHLGEDARQMIETEFGIPVLSVYSAVEAFKIGFTCLTHQGFHLHTDLLHLRVVDEKGVDVPAGESGEIVISNLMNRGSVLLNYRLGDNGQLSTETCSCGRTLPLLARIEGRRDDVAPLPNGQTLNSAVVWLAIQGNPDFLHIQLVQHTLERFELKIATVDQSSFERASADLLARVQPLLGPGTTLTATYVSPFEPFGVRKRSQLVSLVNRA